MTYTSAVNDVGSTFYHDQNCSIGRPHPKTEPGGGRGPCPPKFVKIPLFLFKICKFTYIGWRASTCHVERGVSWPLVCTGYHLQSQLNLTSGLHVMHVSVTLQVCKAKRGTVRRYSTSIKVSKYIHTAPESPDPLSSQRSPNPLSTPQNWVPYCGP